MGSKLGSAKKIHPITVIATEVGNLAYACRTKGYSLRLLAAMMDTNSYGVVYQSMISAAKGRGGVRGPTHHSEKALLESNAKHLLTPMAARGITPRRWCTAYSIELCALFAPEIYESNTDIPVLALLQEDFPEAFGQSPVSYIHAYKKMQGFRHITQRKKKIHVYKSSTGITVVSHCNGKALVQACKIQGLMFQAQRLRVLLNEGPEMALDWVPVKYERMPLKLSEHEEKMSETLKRQGSIADMISELAALPGKYASQKQVAAEEKILSILNAYGVPEEQIHNAVKSARQKAGRY